eukprot:93237_1
MDNEEIKTHDHWRTHLNHINVVLHTKEIRLLHKILCNVLDNPNNKKYKDLNLLKISEKFANCETCIELLYASGFTKSKDSKRLLLLDVRRLSVSETIKNTLSLLMNKMQFLINQNNMICSKYLLYSSDLYVNDEYKCDVRDCLCLQTLAKVLQLYQHYLHIDMNKAKCIADIIFNKIGNNYGNADVLDDFNHLLLHHSNDFDHIYDELKKNVFGSNNCCKLSQCSSMHRNQRDRTKAEHLLNEMYCGEQDIVSQQLLDRVHCYYFHSFDTGYRLTNEQRNAINNMDTKNDGHDLHILSIRSIVESKQKQYKNAHYKYVTDTKQSKLEKYNYGTQFYYWEHSKHDHHQWLNDAEHHSFILLKGLRQSFGKWYIQNKFKSLKAELMQNALCWLNTSQFSQLTQHAREHIQTDKVKGMFCAKVESAKCFDMKYGQLISVKHLISMMVYCNFNTLQQKFSETFRKLDEYETDQSLRQRHSNFYHLARLLRECVECFGMTWGVGCQFTRPMSITVYRGISKQFTFSSMNAFIFGPFSTTTDFAVATNFCNGQGMILELGMEAYQWMSAIHENIITRLPFMDMCWISDFANEQEILFMSGSRSLLYKSVIDVSIATNYVRYVGGLRRLGGLGISLECNMDTSVTSTHIEMFNKQMAFRFLSHELHGYLPNHPLASEFKGCPNYIRDILHCQCTDVRMLIMNPADDVMFCFFKDHVS